MPVMKSRKSVPRPPGAEGTDRRRLLTLSFWGGLGLLGSSVAGVVGGFLSNSFRCFSRPARLSVGRFADLPASGYLRVEVAAPTRSFWCETTLASVIYVRREEGGRAVAMQGKCSHMGCAVHWDAGNDLFLCPCHEGRFDADGNALSGPAVVPLARLEAVVEGGDVFVELPAPS